MERFVTVTKKRQLESEKLGHSIEKSVDEPSPSASVDSSSMREISETVNAVDNEEDETESAVLVSDDDYLSAPARKAKEYKRSFVPGWFKTWSWLSYNTKNNRSSGVFIVQSAKKPAL